MNEPKIEWAWRNRTLREMRVGDYTVVETDNDRRAFLNSAKWAGFTITTKKIDGLGFVVKLLSHQPSERRIGQPQGAQAT